jgi:Protein of unknown function (DUF3810)
VRIVRALIVFAALAAALVPLPASLVETHYSRGAYVAIQSRLTPLSNTVPIALLDVAIGLVLAGLIVVFWRRLRDGGLLRAVLRTLSTLIVTAATAYLAFLLLWGLNYRRQPLERTLEFDESRVTAEAALALARHAARIVNDTHQAAHAADQSGPALPEAFDRAQRMMGASGSAVPGVPKRSILGFYFRTAAIDGMTDPYFLEIILNPEVLPFEEPFVLAHEWGHLAGYAHEAEASFLAWLTCTQGNARARYSGWLVMFELVSNAAPWRDRRAMLEWLGPGPRADLASIVRRYERSSPVVRTAAQDVYDTYLRANRVDEGIASYRGVVRLILGAGLQDYSSEQPLRLRQGR